MTMGRAKYTTDPKDIGINCRHRKAKTKRRGMCPKCYEKYVDHHDPTLRERRLTRARENSRKRNELNLARLRAYHANEKLWVVRNKYMQRVYGITIWQYNQMLREQQHGCFICGNEATRLNIDHCHATGRVRGLLCWKCNRGLQAYNDNPALFRKAVEYLERPFDGRAVVAERTNFIQDLGDRVEVEGIVTLKGKRKRGDTRKAPTLVAVSEAVWTNLEKAIIDVGATGCAVRNLESGHHADGPGSPDGPAGVESGVDLSPV
jgi:hypothetical protein